MAYLINFLSVLILLFCAGHYIVKHWFTVEKIIIEGNISRVTPVQLSYVAHNKLHGTLFTLDIVELKREFEQLPWVRQVSVKRHFPHTVEVSLVEYKAVARINDNALLAEDGEVFDGADSNVALPILYTDTAHADTAYAKYQQIEKILERHSDKISKLWVDNLPLLKFITEKNLMVTICDANSDEKLSLLDTQWDKLHQINPNIATMNFCYKNAVAISPIK